MAVGRGEESGLILTRLANIASEFLALVSWGLYAVLVIEGPTL